MAKAICDGFTETLSRENCSVDILQLEWQGEDDSEKSDNVINQIRSWVKKLPKPVAITMQEPLNFSWIRTEIFIF